MKLQVFISGILCLAVFSGVFSDSIDQYSDQKLEGIIDGLINSTINKILKNTTEPITVIKNLTLTLNKTAIRGSAKITNVNLKGIKDLVASKIDVSISSLAMNATIQIPHITVDTTYIADFFALKFFPLFGAGSVNASIEDIVLGVGGKVNLTGGLSLSNVTVAIQLGKPNFTINGLLDDEELDQLVTQLVNEIMDYVIDELINKYQDEVTKIISPIAEEVINAILRGGSKMQLDLADYGIDDVTNDIDEDDDDHYYDDGFY